jgi:hypothetical protein
MIQARLNLITTDPLRLGDSVTFIQTEVRPAVERLAASRSTAAAARVQTVTLTGCAIRTVEEYGLIFSSAHNP